MIDNNKFNQYGFERSTADIQGITFHNILNTTPEDYQEYLNNECKDNDKAFHYIFDYNGGLQLMPDDWAIFHTGKALDYGNTNTIAIAICSNIKNDLYLEGEEKAVNFVKELMATYNLTNMNLYFHNDFNKTIYCPSEILNLYMNKKTFINKYFIEGR